MTFTWVAGGSPLTNQPPTFPHVPGKTLLAKAVANQTSATFLRVVGSELIQKYLGDGPKLVRELFRVAEEHAPSIVFIDEIDAIGTKRYRRPAAHSYFRSCVRNRDRR